MALMDYTQLSVTYQLGQVRNRIKTLEEQHLGISMNIQAPGMTGLSRDKDLDNLGKLEEGLATLKAMETALQAKSTAGTP